MKLTAPRLQQTSFCFVWVTGCCYTGCDNHWLLSEKRGKGQSMPTPFVHHLVHFQKEAFISKFKRTCITSYFHLREEGLSLNLILQMRRRMRKSVTRMKATEEENKKRRKQTFLFSFARVFFSVSSFCKECCC